MNFTQKITVASPAGDERVYENAYIYDNESLSLNQGIFYPDGKHIAIIPQKECDIFVGYCARYNNVTRTVTAVYDNTKKSRLMPHIRLTLE